MNFSKLPPSGIPLWWLLFKGEKTVTRRVPPCLNCGKKPWLHSGESCPQYNEKGKLVGLSNHLKYAPDLTRWMPYVKSPTIADIKTKKMADEIAQRIITGFGAERTLAICPSRGKAAICKNCGGWKEWHLWKEHAANINGAIFVRCHSGEKTFCFLKDTTGAVNKICSHYEPFRLKVKSVMMESEWITSELKKEDDWAKKCMGELFEKLNKSFPNSLPKIEDVPEYTRAIGACELGIKEATREGFNGDWNALQEALFGKGGYLKGTPLARLEFSR